MAVCVLSFNSFHSALAETSFLPLSFVAEDQSQEENVSNRKRSILLLSIIHWELSGMSEQVCVDMIGKQLTSSYH